MSEYKYWYKKGNDLLQEIAQSTPADNELLVWYIGQCGFIFKRHNAVIYMDPVLGDITGPDGSSRKYYEAPFPPEDVHADYVICTHAHADHMDLATLKGIASANVDASFIVPGDCIPQMSAYGIAMDRIQEARAGEVLSFPDGKDRTILLHPVSAAHPTHGKTADGGDKALSYMIDFDGISVLHMGDTYLTDQLFADLKALPAPDLFLTPINGGDYFRTSRDCIGNLNALESAHLAVELGADLTIPMHYDMIFDNTVDPLDFVRELRRLESAGKAAYKWKLPTLGEMVVVKQ